jgi:hypothetical protein
MENKQKMFISKTIIAPIVFLAFQLCGFSFSVCAQDSLESPKDKIGSFTIGASIQQTHFANNSNFLSGGVYIEGMVTNTVGFETGLVAGNGFTQVGGALIAAPMIIIINAIDRKRGLDGDEGLLLLFSYLFLFERTNFHIRTSEKTEVVPFISLMHFNNMAYNNNGIVEENKLIPAGSLGVKFCFKQNVKWRLNAYANGEVLYNKPYPIGWQAGFNLGYVLKQ